MNMKVRGINEADQTSLPPKWTETGIGNLIGMDGIFCDGDWVESKDQDPLGDVRLIQLADVGDGQYRNKSNRFLTPSKAAELRCTYLNQAICSLHECLIHSGVFVYFLVILSQA